MSGECDRCSEHALECTCETLYRHQEYDRRRCYTVLSPEAVPLCDGMDVMADMLPEPARVHVNGRKEHEAILKDAMKCQELGLDQSYEITVYLNRWGSWLGQ